MALAERGAGARRRANSIRAAPGRPRREADLAFLFLLFRSRRTCAPAADNRRVPDRENDMLKTGSWVAVALLLLVASALAQAPDMKTLAAQLKQGGHVIVFRHGSTNRDQADTDPLNPGNLAKQRLLSEKGKEVALQVGAAYRKLGIPIGDVYTSVFNRAVETGKLVSGRDVVSTTLDVTEGGL